MIPYEGPRGPRPLLTILVGALLFDACAGQCVGTLAGVASHLAVDGASAVGALFAGSQGAVADQTNPGNILLTLADRLLLIDRDLVITRLAGGGSDSETPSDYPAVAVDAALSVPYVSVGATGRVILVDSDAIREYHRDTGQLTLVAGNASGVVDDGALAADSQASGYCVHVARSGDIYYCDGAIGTVVRVVRMSGPDVGRIFTVAGDGSDSLSVDGAPALETGISWLYDTFCEDSGDVLIADNDPVNPRILRVSHITGLLTVVAGTTNESFSGTWFYDGAPARSTALPGAWTVCAAQGGTVYFSDSTRVIRVSEDGRLYVLAGLTPSAMGSTQDGAPFSSASFGAVGFLRPGFSDEQLIASLADNSVYILDLVDERIRFAAGILRTEPLSAQVSDGNLASHTLLDTPTDIAVDPTSGDVFVSVSIANAIVRVFAADGTLSVVADNSVYGGVGVNATRLPPLAHPSCVVQDAEGRLVICDYDNCLMRRLDADTGIAEVVAGNTSALCSVPTPALMLGGALSISSTDPPEVFQFPSESSVYHPRNAAVDLASGDIYWTADTAWRVIMLRAAGNGRDGSTLSRIAGSGFHGPAWVGGLAVQSPLMQPIGIAFDPTDGSVIFVDSPSSVLRVLPNGVLVAVALVQSTTTLIEDGLLAEGSSARAVMFYGLELSPDKASLLLTDVSSLGSVVRVVSLVAPGGEGVEIKTVAGSLFASASSDASGTDDVAPLGASFQHLVAVRNMRGGNMLTLDRVAGVLYTVVCDPEAPSFCPAGYICPCGTPRPCTDPRQYCLANELASRDVPRAFYSVGRTATSPASPAVVYASVAGCPIGSFCVNGSRLSCWPGTYGVAELQTSSKGCARCPAGTYSSSFGAVGRESCLACPPGFFAPSAGSSFCSPCPIGTANPGVGAASATACLQCNAAAFNCTESSNASSCAPALALTSLPGAAFCAVAGAIRVASAGSVATFQDIVPFGSSSSSSFRVAGVPSMSEDIILVAVCVPVALLVSVPALIMLLTRACRRPHGARGFCGKCGHRAWLCAHALLRDVDMYGLRHFTPDGASPFKRRTSLGGSCSLLGIGAVGCLAGILVVQFVWNNSLTSISLLPAAAMATPDSFVGLSPVMLDRAPSIVALSSLSKGVELTITALGPACAAPLSYASTGLLGGSFVARTFNNSHSTAAFVHVFSCPDCAFSYASSLNVTFAAECAAFLFTAASVGASGSTYIASIAASGPDSVASESALALAGAHVTLVPQLQVLDDRVTGHSVRGYSVVVTDVKLVTTAAVGRRSTPVLLDFSWAASDSMVSAKVVPIVTATQLVSSVVGLLGLLTAFGVIFSVVERAYESLLWSKTLRRPPASLPTVAAPFAATSRRVPSPRTPVSPTERSRRTHSRTWTEPHAVDVAAPAAHNDSPAELVVTDDTGGYVYDGDIWGGLVFPDEFATAATNGGGHGQSGDVEGGAAVPEARAVAVAVAPAPVEDAVPPLNVPPVPLAGAAAAAATAPELPPRASELEGTSLSTPRAAWL